MSDEITFVRMFPMIRIKTLKKAFEETRAVIISTYGTGNFPISRKEMFQVLKDAVNEGIIVVNLTQCRRGAVNHRYATGTILSQEGIILGEDMTEESCFAKLSYLLGKVIADNTSKIYDIFSSFLQGYDNETIKETIVMDMRGELTCSIHPIKEEITTSVAKVLRKIGKRAKL